MLTSQEIEFFKGLVHTAGQQGLHIQKKDLDISRKPDKSIVTYADTAIQDFLITNIKGRYQNVLFIHEENFNYNNLEMHDDSFTVIIDPVDGTAMYSMHLPIWCVSVGVYYGYKPVAGFVYAPGADMFFHADHVSAYLNDTLLTCNQELEVDNETNIFYASEIHEAVNIRFPGKVRNLGSTAFQACLTADNIRNRTLAFIGKAYLWDWAGALPILERAGVHVSYLSGKPLNLYEIILNKCEIPDFIVAYTSKSFETINQYLIPV